MRQSQVTGLEPANDNAAPPIGQGDLFASPREIVVGPVSIGQPVPDLVGHIDARAVDEILRRGGEPA